MADEIENRGDDLEPLGDESGDTLGDGDGKVGVEEPKDEPKEEPKGDEPKDEPKDDEPRIPKSRFDQAVAKARAAEKAQQERADKLEAELATRSGTVDYEKAEAKLDTLEEDLEKAIADGNVEAKVRLRKEIRQMNQQLAESRAAAYSQHATAVAVEQIRYDALVDRMETEHPELNPDNVDTFDETVVAEIMDYKSAFEAKGEASTVALKKALKAVYGTAKPAEKKEEPDEKDEGDLKKKADDKAAVRKGEAVKKALDTKGKQPADTGKTGLDSDKAGKSGKSVDIDKMTDKDYDKLDEAEKRRLRGDEV